jgi:hypothetical protein
MHPDELEPIWNHFQWYDEATRLAGDRPEGTDAGGEAANYFAAGLLNVPT